MCYTAKEGQRLSQDGILEFVGRYQKVHSLETITLCGGELFLLQDLAELVNKFTNQKIFIQLITNGTIDRLEEFSQPNQINLIVSMDGVADYHDLNRGQGSWHKSVKFMQHANKLGFHLSIFSIVTRQNLSKINRFENSLFKQLGFLPDVTYHPRKPMAYLNQHSRDRRLGQIKNFEFLNYGQLKEIWQKKQTFPPYKLGCYQVSVFADGLVYGCCEGVQPLGKIEDPIKDLIEGFKKRVVFFGSKGKFGCQGCIEPNFICGFKEIKKREET